jgi:hypothetical protein
MLIMLHLYMHVTLVLLRTWYNTYAYRVLLRTWYIDETPFLLPWQMRPP